MPLKAFTKSFPCALEICSAGKKLFIACRPRKTINLGEIILSSARSHSRQDDFSSGKGSRLFGGRYFTILVMYTSSLFKFIASSISAKNFPAAPTNGRPCSSSDFPGASPINTISASALPSPGTACLAVFLSSHWHSSFHFVFKFSNSAILSMFQDCIKLKFYYQSNKSLTNNPQVVS